jgi:hypothetical protein
MPDYVDLAGGNVFDSELSPTDATATMVIGSAGQVTFVGNNVPATETWLKIGVNSDYEVFVTNGGPDALTSGTVGSWLALTSNRTYTLTETGAATKNSALTVQIRKVSLGNLVVATAVYNLRAMVNI